MYKRWISLLMALILIIGIVSPGAAVAVTTDDQDTGYADTTNESSESTEATEPSDPTEVTEVTGPSDPTEVTDVTEPSDPTEVTDVTEPSDPEEGTEPVQNAEDEEQSATVPDMIVDELSSGNEEISVMSLQPLQEIKAFLVLHDKTEAEIKAMPLSEVLSKLQDSNGNYITVDPEATVVWAHFKDEAGNVIRDEYHEIGRDETVDLSEFEYTTGYVMELIVGSKNQLDPNNIRYLVRVYLTSSVTESMEYILYTQSDDGVRTKVVPRKTKTDINSQMGIDTTSMIYMVPEHVNGIEYYLGITSLADEHPNIATDIYTFDQFIYYLMGGASMATPITDQVLHQDMTALNAGYKCILDAVESVYDQKNVFAAVYTDITTNSMINYDVFALNVVDDISYLDSELFTYDENGQRQEIVVYSADEFIIEDLNVDSSGGTSGLYMEGRYYMIKQEYSADDEVYFALDAHSNFWEDDANGHVVKAVVGLYYSLDEAADAEDIKEQLIPVDRSGMYGYKANYNAADNGVDFTVFFDDDTIFRFNVRVMAYDPKYDPDYIPDFSNAPIVGEADPWFRVTGAKDVNGNVLDTYIVENGKAINLDTMYGYGYQTILINDVDADLSQLQPVIWLGNDERIKVYVNGVLYNEGDVIDCSAGSVQFTAIIDGNQRNYQVTFVQKTLGSDLCVIGPALHEVFLDEYFEYKHDILIANLGNTTLTGLRVELNATNCKLDDYWTIGGEGNDTLAPFDVTASNTLYGELANLAKIRLLPDGDGDIEGTLTVYADGQEPVVITLTGRAQNPKITTTQESFAAYTAVKYVPYAYLISTSNMYDWTDVSFTLTGKLPDGMEFYPETGEIYGVPQETGEYVITIEASFTSDTYEFESSSVELTLTVLENTNANVYLASDANYEIKQHVGTQTGEYDFVLDVIEDTVFTSYGELGEFVAIWLNGRKLVEGVDYFKEEGSTKITIKSQTLEEETNDDGSENTIAMEFRTETESEEDEGELKRTAQNFTVKSSVEKVIEMIDALPSSINLSHKSAVQAARAAYDALSETDKAKVTNYSKLTAAESTIAQLEANQTAANKVINMINNLPSTITLADKEAVEAARAAYDALTSAQKNLVTNYERLQKAESAIAQLEAEQAEIEKNKAAAKVVIDLIDALPSPITLADKDAVSAARAAYNNLTADQKGYVTNYDKLTAAEATIAELEAKEKEKAEVNAVIALINEIPNPVTLDDKGTVEAARAAYDALSPEQQEDVVNYKILTDAEATIAALEAQQEADEADKAAADAVVALIDAIPDPVTLDDKETVEAAREAYDGLTDTQKQLVSNYSDLTDAEAAIKTLEDYAAADEEDRAAADAVIELIDALPEEITLGDKAQVEEARNAYDNLTDNQKGIVTNYDKLTAAESKIAELEDSEYEEVLSVTLVAMFVDAEGKPLADAAIELHSVIQTGRTDGNGSILFNGVEFGEHTIYTKDTDGNVTAQKSFIIVLGTPLGMSGDVITAENGAVFTVTIQQNGTVLTILNIEDGNKAPEIDTDQGDEEGGVDIGGGDDDDNSSDVPGSSNPQTGDDTQLMFCMVMMFASLAGLIMVFIGTVRQSGKFEKRRRP